MQRARLDQAQEEDFNMEKENIDTNSVLLIFSELNRWMEQTHNSKTGEIESTGEAQAFIRNKLNKLDSMKIEYRLADGKYIWVK